MISVAALVTFLQDLFELEGPLVPPLVFFLATAICPSV